MADMDLKAAFDMTPEDAVSYFRSKGYQITDRWQEMLHEAHAKAFTVAKVSKTEVLALIRSGLDEAMTEGLTQREFAKRITPLLQKEGWWGKQTTEDGREIQLGSPRRLKTIYRTNMQTAFMAGRYRRQLANAESRPYWMYVSILDGRTRPTHRALNGRVFHFQDPVWRYLYPPNGWGCRCRVRALTASQVERMGITVEDGASYIKTFRAESGLDKSTGEVFVVDHMRVDLPDDRSMSPDLGWAYNPGEAAYGTDMAIAKKIGAIQSIDLRAQLIQALNNSPERHRVFAEWARQVLEAKRPGHGVQVLGFMPEDIYQIVKEKTGIDPVRVLVVNEKRLVHSESKKHLALGSAMSLDQLMKMPKMIQSPEAVLREITKDRNILLVYEGTRDRKVKIAIRIQEHLKKQPQHLDAIVNAYEVKAIDLLDKGHFEVLTGKILMP